MGRPLKYRLVDAQPLLYSVGVDRDDDGGRLPRVDELPIRLRADPNKAAREWQSTDTPDLPDGDWILWPPLEE